jgi:hypothetical protein
MKSRYCFDINRIQENLKRFQQSFEIINKDLSLKREPFTDDLFSNLLAAYGYLNELLQKGIGLFTPAGLHCMLEMNHIVLCGTDPSVRYEYHNHILETRRRYKENVTAARKWILTKDLKTDPFNLAAGFYVRTVSQPQLFIEGNHRTENVIFNYILLKEDLPPFVVTAENAYDYFELSSEIKFMKRKSLKAGLMNLSSVQRRFARFLQGHVDCYCLRESEES